MMGKSFKIPWFQSPPTSKHFWGVPPCSHLGVPFASNPSKRGWSIARVLETWRIPYGRMIYKWWIFNIYLGQFTVGYLCLSMGIYDCTSGIIYIYIYIMYYAWYCIISPWLSIVICYKSIKQYNGRIVGTFHGEIVGISWNIMGK